jgi:glycerol-3-phosphate dehydrogenase
MDLDVLIVGGGIHGVGALHDLASRGLRGVHLVERGRLASATSGRSTKLLHGGLRYLEHPGQWGLVREALRERTLLLGLLPGVVRPLPIVLPCARGSRPPWMVRLGLRLYDGLAGGSNLPRVRRLWPAEVRELAPYLPEKAIEGQAAAFLYYDAQMRDDAFVRLVAAAATKLGAAVSEHTEAAAVTPVPGGFRVELVGPAGRQTVTARTVVNAAGAWCSANLLRWGLDPEVVSVLNVGSHLLFRPSLTAADPDRSAAALFQNDDGRVVFFLPWFGQWLLGTTESLLAGDPSKLRVSEADRTYLLAVARTRLGTERPEEHVAEAFAGVRTMPVGKIGAGARRAIPEAWRRDPFSSPYYLRTFPRNLSAVSREAVLDENVPGLLSVYGGKFTTYRAQCERVGDALGRRLGVRAPSATRSPANWFLEEIRRESPRLFESDPDLRSG